ncbi:MAG: hypothetical protein U1G07_17680 [Verrucomicrobiota bacterium]
MDNPPPSEEDDSKVRLQHGEVIDQKLLAKLLTQAANALHAAAEPSTGLSTEEIKLLTELKPLLDKDPDAGNEALRLYVAKYKNVIKDVTLQELYRVYEEAEQEYTGEERIRKVGTTINNFCRKFGKECCTAANCSVE